MFSTTFASLVELVSSPAFSTQVALRSPWHGPAHWRGVAHVGLMLDADDAQCDLAVVLAFAALHDTSVAGSSEPGAPAFRPGRRPIDDAGRG